MKKVNWQTKFRAFLFRHFGQKGCKYWREDSGDHSDYEYCTKSGHKVCCCGDRKKCTAKRDIKLWGKRGWMCK